MAEIGYQAPQTTAQEVLSYKGDPALAGGFDSKGQSIGLEGLFTPVNDMIKQLQGQAFTRSMAEWNQSIKDRDQSLEMLRDPRLNVDMEVSEEDRADLENQRESIIEQWKSNPSMDDMGAYGNFQKSVQKFQQTAAASKSRNLEKKKQLQAIAQEKNMATRKAMIEHLDNELKQGVNHQVQPYFRQPSFDATMFSDVPLVPVGEPEYTQDVTGAYHATKLQRTPVKSFSDFVAPEKLMANNGERLQQLQLFHDNFVQSPFAQDANSLTAMNTKLAKINADNGLAPNSPDFLQPVAQQDKDGKWNVNTSPAQFAKSMYAFSKYQEDKQTGLAPDYQKQVKMKAETDKANAQEDTQAALRNKYTVEAEEAKRKGDVAAEKLAQEKASASGPATDAYNMFKDVSKYKVYKGTELTDKTKWPPGVMDGLKRVGFTEDMEVIPLPMTNTYRNALAVSQARTLKGGASSATGNDIIRPSTIVAFRKPGAAINDVKLVGFAKGGKFMKAIDINEAPGEIIKANAGYKQNDKTQKQIDASRDVMNHLLTDGGPDAQQPKQGAATMKTLPPTTELRQNGGAVEANVDGKWVKVKGKNRKGEIVID